LIGIVTTSQEAGLLARFTLPQQKPGMSSMFPRRTLAVAVFLAGCDAQRSEDAGRRLDARVLSDVGLDAGTSEDATIHTADAREEEDAYASADAGPPAPLDLRPYFAHRGARQTYRTHGGALYGHYVFAEASADFRTLYDNLLDQRHPGRLLTWQKIYDAPRPECTATYGLLWLGDDWSVTEVGDWYANDGCTPSVAFGYQQAGRPSGIFWSPAGGLETTVSPRVDVDVFRQLESGTPYTDSGYDAHSAVVLLEHLPTWTSPVGRSGGSWAAGNGRTYTDVLRVLFYHGTRSPEIIAGTRAPRRCEATTYDATSPLGRLYRSFDNYETYAIELTLARDVGIVREALAYTESDYWGASNVCRGAYMGMDAEAAARTWGAYLDE
jgi:hypothetical protein